MSAEQVGRTLGMLWHKAGWLGKTIFFAGIAVLLAMCSSQDKASIENNPPNPAAQAAPVAAIPVNTTTPTVNTAEVQRPLQVLKNKPAPTRWEYRTSIDKMTGKTARYASVDADDHLSFGFPYKGPNRPTLLIRAHPSYGTDVLLQIEKGQFICRVSNCSVMVRFDDKPAARFTATEPADYSSTVLFLTPTKKLIAAIKAAKVVHVQATFHQEGDHIMTFQTSRLEWK